MKHIVLVGVLSAIVPALGAPARSTKSYRPSPGYVPDSATAVRVAEAISMSMYGKALIQQELPLTARLKGEVWVVTGQLPNGATRGGVAVVELARHTGRVLRVTHGQ